MYTWDSRICMFIYVIFLFQFLKVKFLYVVLVLFFFTFLIGRTQGMEFKVMMMDSWFSIRLDGLNYLVHVSFYSPVPCWEWDEWLCVCVAGITIFIHIIFKFDVSRYWHWWRLRLEWINSDSNSCIYIAVYVNIFLWFTFTHTKVCTHTNDANDRNRACLESLCGESRPGPSINRSNFGKLRKKIMKMRSRSPAIDEKTKKGSRCSVVTCTVALQQSNKITNKPIQLLVIISLILFPLLDQHQTVQYHRVHGVCCKEGKKSRNVHTTLAGSICCFCMIFFPYFALCISRYSRCWYLLYYYLLSSSQIYSPSWHHEMNVTIESPDMWY